MVLKTTYNSETEEIKKIRSKYNSQRDTKPISSIKLNQYADRKEQQKSEFLKSNILLEETIKRKSRDYTN